MPEYVMTSGTVIKAIKDQSPGKKLWLNFTALQMVEKLSKVIFSLLRRCDVTSPSPETGVRMTQVFAEVFSRESCAHLRRPREHGRRCNQIPSLLFHLPVLFLNTFMSFEVGREV